MHGWTISHLLADKACHGKDHPLMDGKINLPPKPYWKLEVEGAPYNPFNIPVQITEESSRNRFMPLATGT